MSTRQVQILSYTAFAAFLMLAAYLAHADERSCVKWEDKRVTECKDDRVENAVGGAGLGALAGWIFFGPEKALWGALGGGAVGAATGKSCVERVERVCTEMK